jgi:deoxyribodipyrimidine photo-lyase
MNKLEQLVSNPRVIVRRQGPPSPSGKVVVYWMQRAQRALDNPALDVAVEIANALHQPVVIFFAPVPFYPHANLRHYAFLAQGIPDTAERARKRGIGFVLRRYPDHRLPRFCEEVNASIVIGDENPLREPDHWRELANRKLTVPLWTVDADVIVPSKLLEKEQYAAKKPSRQGRMAHAEGPPGPARRWLSRHHRRLDQARPFGRAGRFLPRWNRRSPEAAA